MAHGWEAVYNIRRTWQTSILQFRSVPWWPSNLVAWQSILVQDWAVRSSKAPRFYISNTESCWSRSLWLAIHFTLFTNSFYSRHFQKFNSWTWLQQSYNIVPVTTLQACFTRKRSSMHTPTACVLICRQSSHEVAPLGQLSTPRCPCRNQHWRLPNLCKTTTSIWFNEVKDFPHVAKTRWTSWWTRLLSTNQTKRSKSLGKSPNWQGSHSYLYPLALRRLSLAWCWGANWLKLSRAASYLHVWWRAARLARMRAFKCTSTHESFSHCQQCE